MAPYAHVQVNGILSSALNIHNGTSQGCPLSPLIFILTLKPFLQIIRAHPDITGMQTGSQHHKLCAYADDLLYYISNAVISVPILMSEIEKYGQLSNYMIKYKKSIALNLNLAPSTLGALQASFPYMVS